jgi:hypothetical protein
MAKAPPRRPTRPFGTIVFGKDGSVRRNVSKVLEVKVTQEASVVDSSVKVSCSSTVVACATCAPFRKATTMPAPSLTADRCCYKSLRSFNEASKCPKGHQTEAIQRLLRSSMRHRRRPRPLTSMRSTLCLGNPSIKSGSLIFGPDLFRSYPQSPPPNLTPRERVSLEPEADLKVRLYVPAA